MQTNQNDLFTKILWLGEETEAAPEDEAELFREMPDIGPRVDLKYLPDLDLPDKPPIATGFKGKLLTPKDGCGASKESAGRIVGGTAAKAGQYPWMALLGYGRGSQISFNCGT